MRARQVVSIVFVIFDRVVCKRLSVHVTVCMSLPLPYTLAFNSVHVRLLLFYRGHDYKHGGEIFYGPVKIVADHQKL